MRIDKKYCFSIPTHNVQLLLIFVCSCYSAALVVLRFSTRRSWDEAISLDTCDPRSIKVFGLWLPINFRGVKAGQLYDLNYMGLKNIMLGDVFQVSSTSRVMHWRMVNWNTLKVYKLCISSYIWDMNL